MTHFCTRRYAAGTKMWSAPPTARPRWRGVALAALGPLRALARPPRTPLARAPGCPGFAAGTIPSIPAGAPEHTLKYHAQSASGTPALRIFMHIYCIFMRMYLPCRVPGSAGKTPSRPCSGGPCRLRNQLRIIGIPPSGRLSAAGKRDPGAHPYRPTPGRRRPSLAVADMCLDIYRPAYSSRNICGVRNGCR